MGQQVKRSRKLEIADRRRKVAHLRIAGWTLEQVADELGVGVTTVWRDENALEPKFDEETRERIGELRGGMFAAYMEKRETCNAAIERVIANGDDPKAIAALVSAWRGIDDQLAKVIGAYAPEKVAGTVAVEMTEAEARKILDEVDV